MAMSFGQQEAFNPDAINHATQTVRAGLSDASVVFHRGWPDRPPSVEQQVDHRLNVIGARLLMVPSEEHASYGRSRP